MARMLRALEDGFDGLAMRHVGEEFPEPSEGWEAPWASELSDEVEGDTKEPKKQKQKK